MNISKSPYTLTDFIQDNIQNLQNKIKKIEDSGSAYHITAFFHNQIEFYNHLLEEHLALELINNKNVLIILLKECEKVDTYNKSVSTDKQLIDDEFKLLKKVFR